MERTAEIFLSHSTIDSGMSAPVVGASSAARQEHETGAARQAQVQIEEEKE